MNSKMEGKSVTFLRNNISKCLLMQCITYDKLLLIEVVIIMDVQKEVKSLRESMNMNRREFCEYFDIPYRTVTDWEAGKDLCQTTFSGSWNTRQELKKCL